MSGAAIILAINLLIAGLFCATFIVIALYDRRFVSARWFAFAYATGMGYTALEAIVPTFTDARVAVLLGHAAFLLTLLLLNVGIARRYGIDVPRLLLLAIFAASIVVNAFMLDEPRISFLRMFAYQSSFAIMQMIGAWIVFRSADRRLIDNLLAWFLSLSALHFLAKPFLARLTGGNGATPQEYLGTVYAMVSQSMGTVLAVATALLLITMLMIDILRDMTARSETDSLSGLLNRRGFEERLEAIMRRQPYRGLPVSVVICDLDHFKQVNDTYGHAVGDRLIMLFAMTLRDRAASGHVLGRIGGEEFAIVMPGNDLGTARLLAESVRTAFSGLSLAGLPAAAHFTASFGVAEMAPGEPPSALMARADAALYLAKSAGRDCVRVNRTGEANDGGRHLASG